MQTNEKISHLLITAAQSVIDMEGLEVSAPLSAETIVLGSDGLFDSMGFVNFMAATEDLLQTELNLDVNLPEEVAGGNDVQMLTLDDLHDVITAVIDQAEEP